MVLDNGSKRIVDGIVKEDDILKENVTSNSSTRRICIIGLSKG